MKSAISPVIVFRVPKFSLDQSLETCWEELKTDISTASPDFYLLIKDVAAANLDNLPEKLNFTIWKYFNRAKFRATPFGSFAAFGIAKGSSDPDIGPLCIADNFIKHAFVNWPEKKTIGFDYPQLVQEGTIRVVTNSTYYNTHETLRYVTRTLDKQFELSELEARDSLSAVLEKCLNPISVNDLTDALEIEADLMERYREFLADMIEMQLLITELEPNIIGTDYFKRIGVTSESTPYIISEIRTIDEQVSILPFKHIPELAEILQRTSSQRENSTLSDFAARFTAKFELKEVPIMVALDPEIGVGYDNLEQAGSHDAFIRQFSGRNLGKQAEKNDLNTFLGSKLNKSNPTADTIQLEDYLSVSSTTPKPLPNSLSAIVRVVDDLVVIDSLGGVTANALNGRFTLTGGEILEVSRYIAAFEQAANPDVLLFDVAYSAETDVDNINRRSAIYDHQLSILEFNTLLEPITINDIMVSVRNNEIFLRSKKLNKRLVPRIATAYNYTRADFSLFRLLCDLQHPGLQTQLSFVMEDEFPGNDFLPEVRFKNIIVSPKKWKLNGEKIKALNNDLNAVKQLLDDKLVSRYFKAGLSDQTLTFDRGIDIDIIPFINFATKLKEFYIEEVHIPVNNNVINGNKQPFHAQFILNLNHSNTLYKGIGSSIIEQDNQADKLFPPGGEWLYFEIYCHPQRTNQILLTGIETIVEKFSSAINGWFFINYNYPSNHIRFRLNLKDLSSYQPISSDLSALLRQDMIHGLISDLQIKTYKREIERYGNEMIVTVEKHFWVDSQYALSILSLMPQENEKYHLCLQLAFEIASCPVFLPNEFFELIKRTSDALNKEHHLNALDFKKLNVEFQAFNSMEKYNLEESADLKFNILVKSFNDTLMQAEIAKRPDLYSNLFHMHVNRLFPELQRTHEMVIYYFMLKTLQRQKAMLKN